MADCLYCHKTIKDKRRKYCNATCRSSYKNGEVAPGAEAGNWSMSAAEPDPIPTIAEPVPDGYEGPVYSMSSLQEQNFLGDGYTDLFSPPDMPLAPEDPPLWSDPPEQGDDEPIIDAFEDDAWRTYTSYLNDPSVWKSGESWIEVFFFDGDFEEEFTGDWDSRFWVPALSRIFEPYPVETLVEALRREYGGGVFQVRFMRSGINRPRKAKPPFRLKVQGEEMTRRNSSVDGNMLFQAERQRAEKAQALLQAQQQAKIQEQMTMQSKVFDLQQSLIDQGNRKEELLRSEIADLRKSGPDNQMIELMERQLATQQEQNRQLLMKQEELRRESMQKDANLFQHILEQNKEAAKAREAEQTRQQEAQLRFAEHLSQRDASFMQTLRDITGGGHSDTTQTLMVMQQQQQKQQEFFMLQMQEERRRSEAALQAANERMNSLMMMVMQQQQTGSSANDPFTQYIMQQQQQAQLQLEAARADHNRLLEKMVDMGANKESSGMEGVIKTVQTMKQVKEVFMEDAPVSIPSEPSGGDGVEDVATDLLTKGKKLAEALNLGRLVESIGKRVERGSAPSTVRAPNVAPPAGGARQVQQQPHGAPALPSAHVQQQIPVQASPGNGISHVNVVPSNAPPAPNDSSLQATSVGGDQGTHMGEDGEEYVVMPEAQEIFDKIEKCIAQGEDPSVWVQNLTDTQQLFIRQVPKDEIVGTVQELASSAIIRSVRGTQWLEAAKEALYA